MTSNDTVHLDLVTLCSNASKVQSVCKIYHDFIQWRASAGNTLESNKDNRVNGAKLTGNWSDGLKIVEKNLCREEGNVEECNSFLKWKVWKNESNSTNNHDSITVSILTIKLDPIVSSGTIPKVLMVFC